MTLYQGPSEYAAATGRSRVRAGTLYSGGIAAAVVAAGVAVVGFLDAHSLLGLPVLGMTAAGAAFQPSLAWYAGAAAGAALAATVVMHLLLLATPRPRTFFGWIVGLATLISMIVPMTVDRAWSAALPASAINLAIGLTIGVLVSISAAAAVRPPALPPPEPLS
ncbi:hypothetical protein GCM10010123_04810 [Pilimelia anulata]|uniref:Uncharacterized protein n=1 Tax=Pilimelia anulata TaxID=53371 RepID=A0A8J3B3Y8_9ACTN|nr:DUF6069 family protein [Pilimelia anulata]GGJ77790.1 hypothetical protein GCM10010123_04810 [Pilimelia anulata]